MLVQPSQIRRLERDLPRPDISIYEHYPNFVASIDFVKSRSPRDQFLAQAPDLVIVDEAHASARPRGTTSGAEHQRFELLRDLARDPNRQILLVTATPHSGIEESFRSLLGLLDLTSIVVRISRSIARRLSRTSSSAAAATWRNGSVPKRRFQSGKRRKSAMSCCAPTRAFLPMCSTTAGDSLEDTGGLRAVQQRVRHWSAIAVLRSLLSSPDAAVMVLGNRAGKLAPGGEGADQNAADIDDAFRPQVLDLLGDHYLSDYAPSGPLANFGVSDRRFRRKAAGGFG